MKRCFVISPIGAEGLSTLAHADDIFRLLIEPAMQAFNISQLAANLSPRDAYREAAEQLGLTEG